MWLIGRLQPADPIDKGMPGPGLLGHVITSKYGDHLPLYRLEHNFACHGVNIARSTMCNWMAASATLLGPLHELMRRRVQNSTVIHTDARAGFSISVALRQGRLRGTQS